MMVNMSKDLLEYAGLNKEEIINIAEGRRCPEGQADRAVA